jgi:hypothetical protein
MDIAEGPTANNSAARVSGPIGKVVESLAAIARVLHGRRLDRNCQSSSLLIMNEKTSQNLSVGWMVLWQTVHGRSSLSMTILRTGLSI